MKRLVIGGYYGAGNAGDEAILSVILEHLRDRWPENDVTVVSTNPAATENEHGVRALAYGDLYRVAYAIRTADLAILGGGGLFQEYDEINIPALFDDPSSGIISYALIPSLASLYEVPCLLLAQGVGPIHTREGANLVRFVAQRSSAITIRDEQSLKLLRDLGAVSTQRSIMMGTDPSVLLTPVSEQHVEHLWRTQGLDRLEPPIIGVAFRAWFGWPERHADALAEELDGILQDTAGSIVFIPYQGAAGTHDAKIMSAVRDRMKASARAVLLPGPLRAAEILGMSARLDLMVSMRLHGLIFAAMAGVPCVGMAFDSKLKHFLTRLELSEFFFDLNTGYDPDLLRHAAGAAISRRPEIRKRLRSLRPSLRKEARGHFQVLDGLLKTARPRGRRFLVEVEPAWRGSVTRSQAYRQAAEEMRRLQQVLGAAQQERERLSAALDERRKASLELIGQIKSMRDEFEARLRDQAVQQERLSAALDEQRKSSIESQAQYEARIASLEQEQEDLSAASIEYVKQIEWMRSEFEERSRDQAIQYEARVAQARADAEQWKEHYDYLLGSRSYRWLAPVRRVYRRWLDAVAPLGRFPEAARQNLRSVVRALIPPQVRHRLELAVERVRTSRSLRPWRQQVRQIIAAHPSARGVIVYPPTLDWNFMFQRPQQLAKAFARAGYCYFFCTNNARVDRVHGFEQVSPGLYLSRAPWAAFGEVPAPILLVSWAAHRHLVDQLPEATVIYDCLDDLEVGGSLAADHNFLLQRADIVIATSEALLKQIKAKRQDCIFAPNGADYEFFSSARRNGPLPEDLRPIRDLGNPIVGYHGALAKWFDYDLVKRVARSMPSVNVVLVGVDYDGTLHESGVLDLENVFWLGMKPYDQLPDYLRGFSVGMIPFRLNQITIATSPIKLWEYLSAGRIVVSTDLPMCRDVPGVLIARDAAEFAQKIQEAFALRFDAGVHRRVEEVARANTWDARAAEIIRRLEGLSPRTSP